MSKMRAGQTQSGTGADAVQLSAGYLSGGAITDNLDGTIDVAAGTGFFRTSNSETAPLVYLPWAQSLAVALTDNSKNYVYIDYNAGSPVVAVQVGGSGVSDNENDKFELVEIYREGTALHITQHRQYANDAISRMQKRFYSVAEVQRGGSGLIIGETGTRNLTLTAGKIWVKLDENDVSAIDTSGADDFDQYYYNGAAWVKVSAISQWDNLQYNNIASGLVTMTNNRWSFQEFYIEPDGGFVSVYGDAEYIGSAGAEAAGVLSFLPGRLDGHALYVGRIVFQKSAATGEPLSPFTAILPGAAATNHNQLSSLQGGTIDQYYHLTAAVYGNLVDANAQLSALHTDGNPTFAGLIAESTAPVLTIHNTTDEDTDGGREGRIDFKGNQSGAEETTLARIEASHDGAVDDQKGKLVIYTNDGSDGDTPTEQVRIDSSGLVTVAADIQVGSGVDGSIDISDSSDVLQESLSAAADNYSKGLYHVVGSVSLADDAEITICSGRAGFGYVNIGDDQERANFSFSTTAVTLGADASANTANTDSDTDLCVYYSGANLNIKNRLGSPLALRYSVRGS